MIMSMIITLISLAMIPKLVWSIERYNVLFVIVDDLRPVLGCYGDEKAHTPNIDKFARQSVLFKRAYAQQALCAPSRNSLLTSRRPDTLGLYDFYSYWRDVAGNYTTLPQHLKNNGYITASFGKVFHPGKSCNHSDDSPYSWSELPFHPSTERYKDAPVCSQSGSSTPASNLICPVRVSTMPNATLPDIEVLKAAKKFLRSTNRQQPFFMAVGFQKPHIPLKYPKRYLKYHRIEKFTVPDNYKWPSNVSSVAYNPWTDLRQRDDIRKLGLKCPWQKIPGRYAKKIIQSYYAAVTYIDDLFAQLLREIDLMKIRNETIIVLTSDHGWSLGEHTAWAKYSNFEVSLHVPLIISIPHVTSYVECNPELSDKSIRQKRPMIRGHIKELKLKCYSDFKVIHEPVELLDLFPTVAELVKAPIPMCPLKKINTTQPDLCSEGSSLVPLIKSLVTSEVTISNKTAISQYPRPGLEPICKPSSDEPRLEHITIMGYTIRNNRYRYTAWLTFSHKSRKPNWQQVHAEELYDHNQDFEENSNLSNMPTYQTIKYELKNTLVERLN